MPKITLFYLEDFQDSLCDKHCKTNKYEWLHSLELTFILQSNKKNGFDIQTIFSLVLKLRKWCYINNQIIWLRTDIQ